jgi:hypothetical protein
MFCQTTARNMGKRVNAPRIPQLRLFAMASPAQAVAAQRPSSLRASRPSKRRSPQRANSRISAQCNANDYTGNSPEPSSWYACARFDVDNTSPDSHVDARIIANYYAARR